MMAAYDTHDAEPFEVHAIGGIDGDAVTIRLPPARTEGQGIRIWKKNRPTEPVTIEVDGKEYVLDSPHASILFEIDADADRIPFWRATVCNTA